MSENKRCENCGNTGWIVDPETGKPDRCLKCNGTGVKTDAGPTPDPGSGGTGS